MKKLLLCIVILACGLTVAAQDIIVTKEAKRIDAKVLEVNVDNVRYRETDNLDGPVYTILKIDIASIIYASGKVETFADANPPQPVYVDQQPVYANPQDAPMTAKQFNDMDDDEIDAYLFKNVGGDIYNTFHSGMKLASTGKKLFIPGIVLSSVGLFSTIMGAAFMYDDYYYSYSYFNETAYGFYWAGICMMGVGEGLIIASIPVRAVGGGKKRAAKNDYVKQYIYGQEGASYTPTLDLNYTGNGLGVVFKF
jgi:hypothetical protein